MEVTDIDNLENIIEAPIHVLGKDKQAINTNCSQSVISDFGKSLKVFNKISAHNQIK